MKTPLAAVIVLTAGAMVLPARAAEPALKEGQHFTIDPVADVVLTAAGAGSAALTEMILSTGEIVPTPPPMIMTATGSVPDTSKLLPFDRIAVTQTVDPNAGVYSDITLATALTFAGVDSVLSGIRDGWDAALVDGVMYAESLSIALFVTDVTKIAVRRPRPLDYTTTATSDTNRVLSFFSGHAALTAAVTGTASYLAFVRSPTSSYRPWITLGAGTLLTAFVSYERVRSGAHFPTDVLAGSLAGAAIGVLVPHLHHHEPGTPSLWIGAAPVADGGSISLQGLF